MNNYFFTSSCEYSPSTKFIERLFDLYSHTNANFLNASDSMWDQIAEMKVEIHEALVSRNINELKELIMNPSKTDLYFGMDTLARYNMPYFNEGGGD